MASSNYTKRLRRNLWILRVTDWVLLFVPLIVYVFIALFDGGVTAAGRVSVVASVMIAIILTAFNVISQKKLRCPLWIVLIGLYVAVKEWLLPLIILLAVTSVLDDIIFAPLIANCAQKLNASKVIDARMGENVREEI